MTRIKICGITNAEDAAAACEFGADALGFIFVPGSPRYVGADTASEGSASRLIGGVPPFVWRVGVFDTVGAGFVAPPVLHAVQYYNEGQPPLDPRASKSGEPLFIRAFRIRGEDSLREIKDYPRVDAPVLLDTYSDAALGGTGHRFDWDLASQVMRSGRRIILAGGLTPENIGEAVRAVRPYMVDVSSGVESEPGRKNHDALRRFIHAVREADRDLAGDREASQRP